MTPLRVLHVIGGVSWKYGGTTATVLPMCAALARQPGVTVEIATTDADGPGGWLTSDTLPTCPAKIRLFRRQFSEQWKFAPGLLRWLWRHAGDYDVIHAHGMWGFCSAAASWAARVNRVPLVVFPQGMLSYYTWSRSSRIKRWYWRLIERGVVTHAARLHLTALGEGKEMERLRLTVPISFIPLGLDPEAWQIPSQPKWLRNQLGGRDQGRPLVLFLSRLHPKKGVADILLPAFAKMAADAYLVIAGGEDTLAPGYEAEVRSEVERLGLSDRVHMLGTIKPEDRWLAFDGADTFVLPSRQENFGLVITEAMARGCPAVVSEHAYACEHLQKAGAGRTVSLDPAVIASTLDELLADPVLRADMGSRGKKYVSENLGWDQIAEALIAMYRETAKGFRR